MLQPIATKGMAKPANISGAKEAPSGEFRDVFYDAERAANLCCNLRLQVLANRPAQVT